MRELVMAVMREFVARTLVAVAIAAGAVALGTWWTSLLVARTAGTLKAPAVQNASGAISSQLDRLAPGTAELPQVESAIQAALHDPAVTQALATSVPKGSTTLTETLAHLDSGLAPLLHQNSLVINVGQHGLARLAAHLRSIAKAALVAFGALSLAALVISPMRHLVLRHLAFGAGLVGGTAVLISWALPALISRYTRGSVHHFLENILSGGNVVRSVILECFIGGVVVFLATHLFELVGGRSFHSDGPVIPLSQGKTA